MNLYDKSPRKRFPASALAAFFASTLGLTTGAATRASFAFPQTPPAVEAASSAPAHLADAEKLLTELPKATLNVYGETKELRPYIDWTPEHPAARTVCSTFAALLLEHSYGFKPVQIAAWLHSATPNADRIHDAIAENKGFEGFREIARIKPGDFLAVKYFDGSKDTGHVMLVDEAPVLWPASEPIIPGTTQYAVSVIDSSASGHGPTDTRRRADGSFTGGIGKGICRLYVDAAGKIAGYTWSTTRKSKYETNPGRDLIVGRVTRTSPADSR